VHNPQKFWSEYYKLEKHSEFIPGGDFCCVNGVWVSRNSKLAQQALKKWLEERPILNANPNTMPT
jgi:hypothetical protein